MTGTSRRRFLQYGITAGAALGVSAVRPGAAAAGTARLDGRAPNLRPFVEPLPLPGAGIVVASPVAPGQYHFTLRQIRRRLHPQLPKTPIFAYDDGSGLGGQAGSFGMAIAAQTGTPVQVSYTHGLPATYPSWIPVDTRLTPLGNQVRMMAHLHGGFVAAADDGNPTVSPDGFGPGETQTVVYPNQAPQQSARLMWFHDHAMGATRLNVFAGLAGGYILRDEHDTGTEPNPIGIPGGQYEIPLVIQDRQFNPDGTFLYPVSTIPGVKWIGEYFGNYMLVNGKVWPYLNVEPRLYRFRVLNGCNARIMSLDLGGAPMWQIGAEGGMWDRPVRMSRLVLTPAERADVIVDFRGFEGRRLIVRNMTPAPPVSTPAPPLPTVMQIRVGTSVTHRGPRHIPRDLPGQAGAAAAAGRHQVHHPQRDRGRDGGLVAEPERRALRQGARISQGRDRGGLGLHQHDPGHPPDAYPPVQPPGDRPGAVQRRGLSEGPRRTGRGSRRHQPGSVRDRPDAAAHPGRARLQGHHQGQPRLLHDRPGQGRAAQRACRRRRPTCTTATSSSTRTTT